jgi:hypothetical protein
MRRYLTLETWVSGVTLSRLLLEEPVKIDLAGLGRGKVNVRGGVRVRGDEAENDVRTLAQIEVIGAGGKLSGPDGHGRHPGCGDGVQEHQIPLLGFGVEDGAFL